MRPDGAEAIRAIQAALAGQITPELSSPFAREAAQTIQMMTESLASDWDTAAEDLQRDSREIAALLRRAAPAFASRPGASGTVASAEAALKSPDPDSIVLSALAARHRALLAALESVLCTLEDTAGEGGEAEQAALRSDIYAHLRRVAVRGWSFWDVASFRERIARARAEIST